MNKKDNIKTFIDEIYSSPPKKNYPTNKIVYNHIDEIWSIDLLDMSDYGISNNKGYRYILVVIDNFSKYTWCVPLKNKYGQTIRDEFSKIISTTKRKPNKIESDRGREFYNNIFHTFLKHHNIHHYSRYSDKGPSIAERVNKSIRNLLKKPIFEKGNASWISELTLVTKKYNNTIHHSTKMTPIEGSKKVNEKTVFSNLRDKRQKHKPIFKLGDLVRTADIKRTFSKGDTTNWSNKLYRITQIIDDTIPSYRINYLPERYNENLLRPTKLTLEENNHVMKKLNLFE